MSLEAVLQENTAAMRELAGALKAGKPAVAVGVAHAAPNGVATAEPGKRPPGRPKKISLDAVKIAAEKVRLEKGRPAAYELIKQHGAEKLADLDEAKYSAFIAACDVILAEREPEPEAEPEAEGDDSL